MNRALLVPALLLTLFAPAAESALVRFTVNGVVGAPHRAFFDPPRLEGAAFTMRWDIDEAAVPTLETAAAIYFHGTPLFVDFPGTFIGTGTYSSLIDFNLLFPAMAITSSPNGVGHMDFAFGTIPWNMSATNRQFTPGTTALTFGNLLADAEYSLDSGTITIEVVPEPATGALALLAIAGAATWRRRR